MPDPSAPEPEVNGRAIGEIWSEKLASAASFSPATFWLAIPEVQRRINAKASRGGGHWINYCVSKYLARLPVDRMLSIGCGNGDLERHVASLGAFHQCDAWDLAPDAIANARDLARKAGHEHIAYSVTDVARAALPRETYDAVWFNSSLHHVEPLERVCEGVARSLKPDGVVFVNEYVGPSAFAFGERQMQAIRAAFHLIPRRLRRSHLANTPEFLEEPLVPQPAAVKAADPSEAVRSADILHVLPAHLDIVERNDLGGTLLQFGLHGIAGNFHAGDPESLRVLDMLFAIEDALIEAKDLESDFTLIVARPRRRGRPEIAHDAG